MNLLHEVPDKKTKCLRLLFGVLAAGLAFMAGLAFVETTFGVGTFLAEAGVAVGDGADFVFLLDFGVAGLGVFFGDGDFVFRTVAGRGVSACFSGVATLGVFFGLGSLGVPLFGVATFPGVFFGDGVFPLGVATFPGVFFFGDGVFPLGVTASGVSAVFSTGVAIFGVFFGLDSLGVPLFGVATFPGVFFGDGVFPLGVATFPGVFFFGDGVFPLGVTASGVSDVFSADEAPLGVFGLGSLGVPLLGVATFPGVFSEMASFPLELPPFLASSLEIVSFPWG